MKSASSLGDSRDEKCEKLNESFSRLMFVVHLKVRSINISLFNLHENNQLQYCLTNHKT